MARLYRYLLLSILLGFCAPLFAVRVQGIVRDAITRLPVEGAVVRMERKDARTETYVTRVDGHYRFEVRSGERAVIRFEHRHGVKRHVVFDATDVPREWTDALEANMDMRLFPEMAGADSLMRYAPAGICMWDPTEENMAWDLERSLPLSEQWNALLENYLIEHPDKRPSDLQRWGAAVFDFSVEWALYLSFALVWIIYQITRQVLKRSGRTTRLVLSLVQLALSIWLFLELGHETGPLRFVSFMGLLVGLMSFGQLILELFLGGGMSQEWNEAWEKNAEMEEHDAELEEPDDAQEVFSAEEPVEKKRGRWRGWVTVALFILPLFAMVLEGAIGLENTLNVWVLVAEGAVLGLICAFIVAWVSAPAELRKYPRLMVLSGGVWWFTLPVLCVTGASFVNRSFPQGEEQCNTWPVSRIVHTRRSTNVSVSLGGEEERLEMSREIKEQLTTLDSLRCCTRTGLLGHEFVFRVEAVLDTADNQ